MRLPGFGRVFGRLCALSLLLACACARSLSALLSAICSGTHNIAVATAPGMITRPVADGFGTAARVCIS